MYLKTKDGIYPMAHTTIGVIRSEILIQSGSQTTSLKFESYDAAKAAIDEIWQEVSGSGRSFIVISGGCQ